MRTSFHTGFLSGIPVLEAISRITDAGFDAVELNAETLPWSQPHILPDTPRDVIEQIARTGVVGSIAAHRGGLADADRARQDEAVTWTVDLARIARDIGATVIHVIPGDYGDDVLGEIGAPGDLDAFITSLRRIVEQTEPLGIAVGLEPIVNQLVNDTAGAQQVLDAVPGLGISFDPSHLEVADHDVTASARRLGSHTVLAALKDATGTPDDFSFPALGAGDIDFVAMLRALRGEGFDGYVCVEHEAHVFGDTRGVDEVLAQSSTFVRDVLAQLDASRD